VSVDPNKQVTTLYFIKARNSRFVGPSPKDFHPPDRSKAFATIRRWSARSRYVELRNVFKAG